MMAGSEENRRHSPWISVWFKPGDTIDYVLAANRTRAVLLLAAVGVAFSLVESVINLGFTAALMEWRNLAAVLLIGLITGIPLLYFNALFIRLSGMLLGGRATQPQIRAALAWSMVPNAVGLVICLASSSA
jgi:hypothetical protein